MHYPMKDAILISSTKRLKTIQSIFVYLSNNNKEKKNYIIFHEKKV